MTARPSLEHKPQGQTRIPSNYKWCVVTMLWFVCFFNYADRQAIFAVFPKLKDEFGFDPVQRGLIGSAFMWVYAAGAPFAGYICDRFRRKDLILGGCLFWSFVTVTTGWCLKLWQFVFVRALEGFGETFYFPASMSLTSDYHSNATRSRALSFHQSSVYIGTILGSWTGAVFAERWGWRVGFYCFGGTGMLLALALYRFLREPQRGESEKTTPEVPRQISPAVEKLPLIETLRCIFNNPVVPLLMLAFLAANSIAAVFLVWTPTFLVEKFHFKLSQAGLTGTVFIHLASACSVPIAGLLADKLTCRIRTGRMIVQAIGLLVGAGFIFIVGSTSTMNTLIIGMTLFGFCKGFYDSGIFASVFDMVEPRARGTAAGIMNTVGWGGGALGPVLVGWIAKHGNKGGEVENMSQAIAFGGVIYLIGAGFIALAIWLASKRNQRPAKG